MELNPEQHNSARLHRQVPVKGNFLGYTKLYTRVSTAQKTSLRPKGSGLLVTKPVGVGRLNQPLNVVTGLFLEKKELGIAACTLRWRVCCGRCDRPETNIFTAFAIVVGIELLVIRALSISHLSNSSLAQLPD